ncbi:hypothetical protein [Alloactinosynnema sp. L-07]|uniref:hypothetical protein n=1 Tax=Alloactinosynnema sp. L-07 TaxID=1653480 RepID=UPI00065EF4DD|nr:hypothetical protein [Alloactinosynnema sp. L-07]CRK59154.1 hypothetical protein [Alloactinosynnema sp. L-07]
MPKSQLEMTTADRDDTTRYLCAAAHLDPDFADRSIREFLVERTRPAPPSPGVDAGVVLAEAVAARTRRKIVGIAALALLLVLLFSASMAFLLGWLVLAFVVAVPTATRVATRGGIKPVLWAVGAVVVVVMLIQYLTEGEIFEVIEELFEGSSPSYEDYYGTSESETDGVGLAFTILVPLGLLGVFLADRFTVWKLITTQFNRTSRLPGTLARSLAGRQIFQFAPTTFTDHLRERYEHPSTRMAPDADNPDDVGSTIVVHRGYDPFVGAGQGHRPWSIAVPLDRAPGKTGTTTLTTAALYDAIVDEVTALRTAVGLTPGGRLARLSIDELVAVTAAELVDHMNEPASVPFIPGEGHPPYDRLSRRLVEQVRDSPIEWARYYRAFRVETWDRDLVLSVYLHVAMDDTMLYVEWTPCVLRPIKEEFQRIDAMSRSPLHPIGQALLDLIKFPTSIPRRLVMVFGLIRSPRKERGVINPDDYGALSSLRELAADTSERSYFQLVDRDRYLKIIESRVVRAVSALLHDAGYVTASFEAQATAVIQNNVRIEGSVTGNVIAGSGNVAGAVTVEKPKGDK